MAAYKKFNSQDIIISPLEVNKSFTFEGFALTSSDVGINRYIGINDNYFQNPSLTGIPYNQREYASLIYSSLKHLYYTNYISGSKGQISNASTASFNIDGTIEGPFYQTNYYNYEQNTVFPNKSLPTGSGVGVGLISIPSKLYGDYIKPSSFKIGEKSQGFITDDGQGRLYEGNECIGNIIYQHGIAIINSDTELVDTILTTSYVTCSFSSSYTIFETQYKCEIGESEFNYTLNPTTLTGSEGNLYDHFTGSYFDPYITTVGMYNENFELLAVGKLAKPLPTSRTTDTTIILNIDR